MNDMGHTAPRGRIGLMRLLLIAAAVAVAFGLVACGGGNNSKPPDKREIEDQLGFDSSGILVRQSRVEESISECMRAQGFEYIPVNPLAQRAAVTGSSRLSDEDFVQQFGYGISTLWGKGTPQADPNQRIRSGLGAPDRAAYDRALYGDVAGATFQEAADTGNFSKLGGCTLKATESVFGGAQVLNELVGKFDTLDERIVSDQRMVRANEKWASCMTGKGFEYEEPDEIDEDLLKQMERIVGTTPGQFATGPAPGTKAQPYDHAALAALQRQEVEVARADSSCEKRFIVPVESVVRPQYEATFREQNQSLIKQVKPVQ